MITYQSLVDHELRFIWISGVSEGVNINDVIGNHPWNLAVDKDANRKLWQAAADLPTLSWYDLWEPADCPAKVFFTVTRRVAARGVLLSVNHYEFPAEFATLSPAEKETLKALGAGDSVKQIAADHWVTESTIRSNIARIRSKMSLYSKEQIALLAFHYQAAMR